MNLSSISFTSYKNSKPYIEKANSYTLQNLITTLKRKYPELLFQTLSNTQDPDLISGVLVQHYNKTLLSIQSMPSEKNMYGIEYYSSFEDVHTLRIPLFKEALTYIRGSQNLYHCKESYLYNLLCAFAENKLSKTTRTEKALDKSSLS